MPGQSVYDFSTRDIEGSERSLGEYCGRVLLIVNVASECGFTPQYTGLETLQRKYASRGFSVLGFPCNQFGPGTRRGRADQGVLRGALRHHVPAVRQDRGQWPEHPPLVCFSQVRGAGPARQRGHQMELHEVPDREGRQGGQALRTDDETRSDRGGHRGAAREVE
jgi:Glutathione peroxidase